MDENEIPDLNAPLEDEAVAPSNSHSSMESNDTSEQNTSSVEKPEWLMDKYLAGGRSVNDAIEVQAKSAMELNRKLSQRNPNEFFGHEEDYKPTVLKDSSHQISADHPLYASTVGVMKELGLNQKGHDKLVEKFIEYEQSQMNSAQKEIENSMGAVAQAEKRVANIEAWLGDRYGDDGKKLAQLVRLDGSTIPVVEKILRSNVKTPMPEDAEVFRLDAKGRKEQWSAMMQEKDGSGQYRLDTDKNFRAVWERLGALIHQG